MEVTVLFGVSNDSMGGVARLYRRKCENMSIFESNQKQSSSCYDPLSEIAAKKLRWCNVSDMEKRKCAELSKTLQSVLSPRAQVQFIKLSCIRAHNVEDCIKKIRVRKRRATRGIL